MRTSLVTVLAAAFQLSASAAVSPTQDKPLDEVVVQGTRGELKKLVQMMVKLEDQFYGRYNDLNTIDDFDTYCDMESRVGTRLERRYCRAVYQDNALQAEGSEYAQMLKRNTMLNSSPDPGTAPSQVAAVGPPLPAIMGIEARQKAYRQNLRDVVAQHPELVDLLRERSEIAKRYEALRKKAPEVWLSEEEEAIASQSGSQ